MTVRPTAFNNHYGFYWYPEHAESIISVERVYTGSDGVAVLTVNSIANGADNNGNRRLEIAVSPKGKNIRVWLDGKQMQVTK